MNRVAAVWIFLLAAALGVLHALSFAPWNLWWLQLIALAALFVLTAPGIGAGRGALLGFAFGLGWFGLGVHWVYISMHTYGAMPALLAGAGTAAFCAYLALYPALALYVAARWHASWQLPASARVVALPALWVGTEFLRGLVLTGFPWLASGYAHSDGPLAGYAAVLGVHGVTWICVLIAAALAALIDAAIQTRASLPAQEPPRRWTLATAVVAAALLVTGLLLQRIDWTAPAGAPINVRLVQTNIAQNLKFGPDGLQTGHRAMMSLLASSSLQPIALAVLPESVFPVPVNDLPDFVTADLLAFTRRTHAALIFGTFIEEPAGHYYNSALALAPDSDRVQRYSKQHLVPFGEFIPWGFRWFVDRMQMPIADQQHGGADQPPLAVAGQQIAVNICYEDLFGADIARAWQDHSGSSGADSPRAEPTLLLNLSNLAWFDDSRALPQHLQIARMRALETGRPVLRATNTGATALIGTHGAVQGLLPYVTAGVLDVAVQGYAGRTPYLHFGDAPIALLVIASVLVAVALSRRGQG